MKCFVGRVLRAKPSGRVLGPLAFLNSRTAVGEGSFGTRPGNKDLIGSASTKPSVVNSSPRATDGQRWYFVQKSDVPPSTDGHRMELKIDALQCSMPSNNLPGRSPKVATYRDSLCLFSTSRV